MPTQDYPDIQLSEEKEKELELYLYNEIERCKRQRKTRENEWKEIDEMYLKTDIPEKKDTPFVGAAHLMLPIIASRTEAMFARASNTIWAPSDPFSAKPLRKEFTDHVRPLRKFMTWATEEELELESVGDNSILGFFKYGTCISKTIYSREPYAYMEYDVGQQKYIQRVATHIDHPEIIDIDLDNFFYPMEARNQREMYWRGDRFFLTWSQLKQREKNNIYKDVEKIKTKKAELSDAEKARLARIGVAPNDFGKDQYEVFEIWLGFDIDGDGIDERIVVFYSYEGRTILRKQHNWFPYQLDPYSMAAMIPIKNDPMGLGVGHMGLVFQREISAMHNQRLDSATLANSYMIKRKANARIGPVVIKPGGDVVVDEMDDAELWKLGFTFQSTIPEENQTMSYFNDRVGWQEFNAQEAMQNTPATTTITAMQEKMRRFDFHVRTLRKYFADIMTKCLLLYQKYYPEGKAFMLMGDDGFFVEETLSIGELNFLNGVGIQVTATTSTTSKELERQAKLSLFQLLSTYYGQALQYFTQSLNPQVPPPVQQALMGIVMALTDFVLEILEDFEIRNAEQLTIKFGELRAAAAAQAQATPPTGNPANGGMAGVPEPGAGGGRPSPALAAV